MLKSFYTENGRMALSAYLRSLPRTEKKYIVLPALTCIGVIQAIRSAGYIPYYVNINENLSYDREDLKSIPKDEIFAVIYQSIYGGIKFFEDLDTEFKDSGIVIIADMAQSYCDPARFLAMFKNVDFVFMSFQKNKPLQFGVGGMGYSREELPIELKASRSVFIIKYFLICLVFFIKENFVFGESLVNLIKNLFDGDRKSGEDFTVIPFRLPRFLEIKLKLRIDDYEFLLDEKNNIVQGIYRDLLGAEKWSYLRSNLSYYSPHYIPIKLKYDVKSNLLYDWPESNYSPYRGNISNYEMSRFENVTSMVPTIKSLYIDNGDLETSLGNAKKFFETNSSFLV